MIMIIIFTVNIIIKHVSKYLSFFLGISSEKKDYYYLPFLELDRPKKTVCWSDTTGYTFYRFHPPPKALHFHSSGGPCATGKK